MKYMLTIQIPFEVTDDMEARFIANRNIQTNFVDQFGRVIVENRDFIKKLRRIHENKPPETVEL